MNRKQLKSALTVTTVGLLALSAGYALYTIAFATTAEQDIAACERKEKQYKKEDLRTSVERDYNMGYITASERSSLLQRIDCL